MTFTDIVRLICKSAQRPLTPQEIREQIKAKYPEFYGTPSHLRNVAKGHYKDLDHALLAQIYIVTRSAGGLVVDKTQKPLTVTWRPDSRPIEPHVLLKNQEPKPAALKADYRPKVAQILGNLAPFHDGYYQTTVFSGPSLHFHRLAIESSRPPVSPRQNEYIYATLTSWGMHRMGKRGAKMHDFDVFNRSIIALSDPIAQAASYDCQSLDETKWAVLHDIFWGLQVMATDIHLVGNSKVMHHLMPHLIPPIDREYTLWYLRGNTSIKNDMEWEWAILRSVIEGFFLPILADANYQQNAQAWLHRQAEFPWDTSAMKIVDNLIIGAKVAAR